MGYDRVVLYDSKSKAFCEGPVMGIETSWGTGEYINQKVEMVVENMYKEDTEYMNIYVNKQECINRARKTLRDLEYSIRQRERELAELTDKCVEENKKQDFDWRYE